MCENDSTPRLTCGKCGKQSRIFKNGTQDHENYLCVRCKKLKPKTTYLEPEFKCTSCEKIRPHKYREKGRNRCLICSNYKTHVKEVGTLTYDQFEENYINKKSIVRDGKKKCISCLLFLDNSKFTARTGAHCINCWYGDEQTKIRKLRKTMRGFLHGRGSEKTFTDTFGYTQEQLLSHLSSLFTDGMTIEKLYSQEIHIDHIIPASAFDHNNPKHVEYCWSLENLQPLWATYNQKKHDYLINGVRVQSIRRKPNARKELDKLLLDLYGFNA